MPATDFHEYVRIITSLLNALTTSGRIARVSLETDARSKVRGLIVGTLLFEDDSELHFREFIDLTLPEPKVMYVYHYQDASNKLIFRYDNATHRPALSQPAHKHTVDGVSISGIPSLEQVLDEIIALFE